MANIVPRVLIDQEFTQVPVFTENPLAALVIGPRYNLYRYSVESERQTIRLAAPYEGNEYVTAFPSQEAGTKVDKSYTKVFFEDAQVEYYPNSLGSTGNSVARVAVGTGFNTNRFAASNLIFKSGNGYSRSAEFSSRDVKEFDVVKLSSSTADKEVNLRVRNVVALRLPSSVDNAVADVDNITTSAESFNGSVVANTDAGSDVTSANASTSYKGVYSTSGNFAATDTYRATVTTGGNLSAVRFSVLSVAGATPAVSNRAVDGTDVLTLLDDGTNVLKINFAGSTLFTVGDTFEISVTAPVTGGVVPTASGTYAGRTDVTYKIQIVRGGPFYDPAANGGAGNASVCARASVTSDSFDSSPIVNVRQGTAFNVGSFGLAATFTSSTTTNGLVAGDSFYVTAHAAKDDKFNIIETYEDLPSELVDGSATDWTVASLSFSKNFEVPALSTDGSTSNWTTSTSGNTVKLSAGVTATDTAIAGGDGTLVPLPVLKATVFVQHRDLVTTDGFSLKSVSGIEEVPAKLGSIDTDNTLGRGVYVAALNSGNVPVYYVAVPSDDVAGYIAALNAINRYSSFYSLVALTNDRAVQEMVVSHVQKSSTPEQARWRIGWLGTDMAESKALYTDNAEGVSWKGTVAADPYETNITAYTLLNVVGATFLKDGVRAGDAVRINFYKDEEGRDIYDTYLVDSVRSETSLVLSTSLPQAVNVPIKIEVIRNFDTQEKVDALIGGIATLDNRRIRAVAPAYAYASGVYQPSYFLAAASAGLRSSVVPHQGLTFSPLLGFDDVLSAVEGFSEDQLNQLADAGYWIITQDAVGGVPYVRHQLTTDTSSLNRQEDSITTNVDSISYGLQRVLAPFIGTWNNHRDAIMIIRANILNYLRELSTNTYTERAGNQLNDFELIYIRRSEVFEDRLEVQIRIFVPSPINTIHVTLLV